MPSLELIRIIRDNYQLPWHGIHGAGHWARVFENGMRLASLTGARLDVVRLFAVFHDCQRENEGQDPGHGRRGADFAATLRGTAFELSDPDFELLQTACIYHTDGRTTADVTVQTCWDADRLDLGRVGIQPVARFLCTKPAKNPKMISWACERSILKYVPVVLALDWELT